jgi:hypothetical protein
VSALEHAGWAPKEQRLNESKEALRVRDIAGSRTFPRDEKDEMYEFGVWCMTFSLFSSVLSFLLL